MFSLENWIFYKMEIDKLFQRIKGTQKVAMVATQHNIPASNSDLMQQNPTKLLSYNMSVPFAQNFRTK